VTEVLAAPADAVPVTVTDTILARLHQLPDSTRAVLEQLSVIPTVVESDLVAALVASQVDALDDAEARGMIELQLGGVVFRHELARRAIEYSLTTYRRRAYNRAVVRALTARPELDLDRIVHHAIEAVDAETVARYAPRAGREASQAGSHRQALAQLQAALRFADWLPDVERARVLDDYAWELYNAHRFDEAVAAGRESVDRYEALGDRLALGEALVRLSRHVYMTGRTDEAEAAALRAVEVLEDSGSTAALAHAVTYQGAMLALTGRSADALAVLDRAHKLALEADRLDLVALGLNYVGVARCDLEGADGIESLRESLVLATNRGYHEYAARAYTNLAEVLYRFGRLAELASCLDDGLGFVEERGFWSHAYNLHVHRALLLARGGNWDAAEAGLRELVDGVDEPGMLYVYSVPPYARLLARRGDPRAGPLLRRAWRRAMKQKSLLGIAYAGIGYVEWAWLTGQAELIPPVRDAVLARTASAGTAPLRAELLRYAARAGVGPVPDRPMPEDGGPFAVGLSGDWRAAAAMWDAIGDRYEQAIELADSGDVAATLDGLRYLDGLGAAATGAIVRRRLRELGVRSVPRGPIAATQANPAGLTDRQLQVLTLMCAGRTNTDIAADLVLSVRTVDHHVAAVLGKLGAHSRHEAVELARLAGVGE
jgi:ATP/maltotriose-dependent transcriptional regulator MalT